MLCGYPSFSDHLSASSLFLEIFDFVSCSLGADSAALLGDQKGRNFLSEGVGKRSYGVPSSKPNEIPGIET